MINIAKRSWLINMRLLGIVLLLLVSCRSVYSLRLLQSKGSLTSKRTSQMRLRSHVETPYLSSLIRTTPKLKYRFFFPGHGGVAPSSMGQLGGMRGLYHYDLPELDTTDNIHSPEGPLLHAQQLAAKLFGARRTWFLLNGCSSGIMMAILSCVRLHQLQQTNENSVGNHATKADSAPRSIFLVGRDAHKSVFEALSLTQDCDAVLLPCAQDHTFQVSLGVTLENIQQAIDKYGSKVCGLLLTRPSYQGLMLNTNDMQAIVKLCHQHGVPVVVDEAHGAHLRFFESPIYQDALSCGADIAVQSTHKTLNSLSQTAMLHIGPGAFQYRVPKTHVSELRPGGACITIPDAADESKGAKERKIAESAPHSISDGVGIELPAVESVVHSYNSMLTTTSPNSVLLASLDAARAQFEEHGADMVQQTALAVNRLRSKLRLQGAPLISLLEDSPEVRGRGLVVDPLRLNIRFSEKNGHSGDSQNRDSTYYDDKLCDELGIYCELNQPQCITYAIPAATAYSDIHSDTNGPGRCGEGAADHDSLGSGSGFRHRAGEQESSLWQLEKALLGLAGSVQQRHNGSAAPSVHECQAGFPPKQQSDREDHQQELGYMHCSSKQLAATHAVPLIATHSSSSGGGTALGNEQLVGSVSAETISVYPPGIPLLVRGEVILQSHLSALVSLHNALVGPTGSLSEANGADSYGLPSGTSIMGSSSATLDTILVYRWCL